MKKTTNEKVLSTNASEYYSEEDSMPYGVVSKMMSTPRTPNKKKSRKNRHSTTLDSSNFSGLSSNLSESARLLMAESSSSKTEEGSATSFSDHHSTNMEECKGSSKKSKKKRNKRGKSVTNEIEFDKDISRNMLKLIDEQREDKSVIAEYMNVCYVHILNESLEEGIN